MTEHLKHEHKRLPTWLRKRVRASGEVLKLKKILKEKGIHTVCQAAGCPNISECFSKPTATFMILGDVCTRHCRFCGIHKGRPGPVDSREPMHIAETAAAMNLRHVVITSVTRDDLEDGGAAHFAETITQLHHTLPNATIEALIPDFSGNQKSIDTVLNSQLDVLNHNVETVSRLYQTIRPEANYKRSLALLQYVKTSRSDITTKSGLMVGLGETGEEMVQVFKDLVSVKCDALTIGQYLAPDLEAFPVKEYIHPDIFNDYKKHALSLGFGYVQAGPYVRSSFHAEDVLKHDEGV
jgi:lipoic acid synthetase